MYRSTASVTSEKKTFSQVWEGQVTRVADKFQEERFQGGITAARPCRPMTSQTVHGTGSCVSKRWMYMTCTERRDPLYSMEVSATVPFCCIFLQANGPRVRSSRSPDLGQWFLLFTEMRMGAAGIATGYSEAMGRSARGEHVPPALEHSYSGYRRARDPSDSHELARVIYILRLTN